MTVSASTPTRTCKAASFDPRSLPALSPLAVDLLALRVDDDHAEKTLIQVIASEPQLSIRLMGVANSVAFSHLGQPLHAISDAVRRIGLARTRQMAIAILFGNPLQQKLPAALAQGLWVHALTMATAAHEIALCKKTDHVGTAFLAGLVHDLGYMAEELCVPGALKLNAEVSASAHISLEQAEHQALGVDHSELTCRMLQLWHAPAEIIEAMRTHHDLDIAPDSLAATLFGAEKLARFVEVTEELFSGEAQPFPGMAIDRSGLDFLFGQQLGLNSVEVTTLVEIIIDQVESFRQCAKAMHGGTH